MTQSDTFQLDKATLVSQSTSRMDKQFQGSTYSL